MNLAAPKLTQNFVCLEWIAISSEVLRRIHLQAIRTMVSKIWGGRPLGIVMVVRLMNCCLNGLELLSLVHPSP